jgi:hypothetical protein
MAIYHFHADSVSRGKGHSTTAAAAYRARCVILDERTGQTHDYSGMKNQALFTGIFAPKDAPAWTHDRSALWNAAEKAETDFNRKKNAARVARDFTLALPHEMTDQQRQWLVSDFVREQFVRPGYVADVAIHAPDEHGDQRNHHCHILVTDRQLTADGFAAEKDRSLKNKSVVSDLRQQWQRLANRHLERHGIEARIDHRSLKDQGIEYREPTIKMGKAASAAERKGRTTERGERQREIKSRNLRSEELLRELAELQQQQGIAAQFKENAVAWYDRAFYTFESLAAAPFGFIFGHDNSPEQYYRDPDKGNTTEINILTDEVTIQQAARAAEQAPAPEQAPETPTAQAALQEQIAREKAYYEAQERERGQEREQEYSR